MIKSSTCIEYSWRKKLAALPAVFLSHKACALRGNSLGNSPCPVSPPGRRDPNTPTVWPPFQSSSLGWAMTDHRTRQMCWSSESRPSNAASSAAGPRKALFGGWHMLLSVALCHPVRMSPMKQCGWFFFSPTIMLSSLSKCFFHMAAASSAILLVVRKWRNIEVKLERKGFKDAFFRFLLADLNLAYFCSGSFPVFLTLGLRFISVCSLSSRNLRNSWASCWLEDIKELCFFYLLLCVFIIETISFTCIHWSKALHLWKYCRTCEDVQQCLHHLHPTDLTVP